MYNCLPIDKTIQNLARCIVLIRFYLQLWIRRSVYFYLIILCLLLLMAVHIMKLNAWIAIYPIIASFISTLKLYTVDDNLSIFYSIFTISRSFRSLIKTMLIFILIMIQLILTDSFIFKLDLAEISINLFILAIANVVFLDKLRSNALKVILLLVISLGLKSILYVIFN